MLQDILFAFWFLLPAAAANASPIFSAVMPGLRKLDAPLDGGRTWHGTPLLGSHKTWRGLISGLIVATLVLWLQQLAFEQWSWAQFLAHEVDYTLLPALILGPLFGLGALGGDAIESFFKRRFKIKSGHSWLPFDQLDYIIGALIVSLPFVILTPMQYLWIIIVWFVVHLLASYIGWLVGLKKQPV